MPKLTPDLRRRLSRLAKRYEVSEDAALAAFQAVSEGGGRMAQFHHPELGGGVQWMRGGMVMVGDMFNNALKARVDGLCTEVSDLVTELSNETDVASSGGQTQRQSSGRAGREGGVAGASGEVSFSTADWGAGARAGWWPESLGAPGATGTQNDLDYAVFPEQRRVALRFRGVVRIYDTGDHRITGISQQQSGEATLTFTSQKGIVKLDRLALLEERADPLARGR